MKVFYTSPWRGRKKFQKLYDNVVKSLQRHEDVDVISLEVLKYEDVLPKEKVQKLKGDELHYEYLKRSISMCDAAVLEASYDSFKIGHETTLALMYGKPVLCLSTKADYTEYLKHPLLAARHYDNVSQLDKLVDEFLDDVRNKHMTIRLNSLITPELSRFLDWAAKRSGKSKSEIIRNLIEKEKNEYPEYEDESLKPFN